MLEALSASGWHNYSLFLDENDGTLVGYLETADFESALAQMAKTEVNRLWQSEMAQYFEELDGGAPDQGLRRLEEVFNLADQLQASRRE
jgi:L-rhamnose mutarotase